MRSVEILLEGVRCGDLTAEENGLYVRYTAVCRPVRDVEPLRLFAVGEEGELRLGVPEPEHGCLVLRKQLSAREARTAGRLLRGELRSFADPESGWRPVAEAERIFREASLQHHVREIRGALIRHSGERCFLAVPFENGRPFLLTELICFAHVRRIGQREYAVFGFASDGMPFFF